ncbi:MULTISPECIES: CaiB/BaiF CoA-transferase family protein [Rhodomicrobium]|uniref:CaiB/BaiF CoA transferase family protein n=1 Tax=Rhodomicrobium TaxID=1068 RepID=UPI000B4A829C|nr:MULTISPECIES: CaiB/BaiF CoA-transferase family protein [Rhodomicrobium]
MIESHEPSGRSGPLAGIRVIDLTRLAPGPYCTMLLADFGAEVIAVGGGRAGRAVPAFARGKRQMALDLKTEAGRRALHAMIPGADVFVEGFRPGVAARLGADYATLAALNPKLVYCSLTGYGQDGPRSQEAGHDINYIAVSGVLGAIGPAGQPPQVPLNLVADFAGGSLVAAFGIMAALVEAQRSGKGQQVDAAMVDGCLSLMAMHFPLWGTGRMPGRGDGLLAGNAPHYRCYACADGQYVSVGALEPAFFAALWQGLGLGETPPDNADRANWPEIERLFSQGFLTRSRDAWAAHFAGTDACVTPVLSPDEVWAEPQIAHRHPGASARAVPPVPRLSRTPGIAQPADASDQTRAILAEAGLTSEEIAAALPGDTAEHPTHIV